MAEMWTIGRILAWTKQYFAAKGVESPRLDAEVLLSHILKQDRIYLYVHFDQPLTPEELTAYREAVKERAQRLPVAYITGYKEFMGLNFVVSPSVLIPRPDTEILVEAVQKRLAQYEDISFADLGTGSGAIVVSLLTLLPKAKAVAVDISEAALIIAEQNAQNHQVQDRLDLCCGDFTQALSGRFQAIVSNPPYIPDDEVRTLAPEVLKEPSLALKGGNDGLDFYRRLLCDCAPLLTDDGFLAIEIGIDQAEPLQALAAASPFQVQEIVKDYGGIERVMVFVKKESKKE
ncbi:MAG: peptide chain release factor N(5)-glutamine methyltransferase [Sporomusaceae bacterium]|nr:peptide chain release factor N(5)-glutamine methyltransferase [Sporomusaceae bacterium]